MSDGSFQFDEEGRRTPEVNRRARRRWQIGLRTLFLLMATIALWLTCFVNLRNNAALEARINAMVPLAHELIVTDPKKIAVVKLDDEWINESRWDIHLPEGSFRLCLATRGIDRNGLGAIVRSSPISSGTHHLFLKERRDRNPWQVRVLCDGKEVIAWSAPHDPKSNRGVFHAGVSQSAQFSPEVPVILLRRQFLQDDGEGGSYADGSTDGVLLWVERKLDMGKQP